MDKYYGGTEIYIHDAYWFSKEKIFNIEHIRSLLEKDSHYKDDDLDLLIEKYMIKLLNDDESDSLYGELDDDMKNKLSIDLKEVLRVQNNIKYIGKLLYLRY